MFCDYISTLSIKWLHCKGSSSRVHRSHMQPNFFEAFPARPLMNVAAADSTVFLLETFLQPIRIRHHQYHPQSCQEFFFIKIGSVPLEMTSVGLYKTIQILLLFSSLIRSFLEFDGACQTIV